MDTCKKTTMVGFMWSLVKQLPLPLLMGLSLVLGMALCWMLCRVSVWFFVGLIVCGIVGFVLAVCNSAKDDK